MMEVLAHVWRKKDFIWPYSVVMSLFHIRDWPSPCYYIKNDNNTKQQNYKFKMSRFFYRPCCLGWRVSCRNFSNFLSSIWDQMMFRHDYVNVGHVTRTCGAWKWSAILRRNKMWQWKNSLDVKFISLGRLVSAFRCPTAHAREISITKKKNGKNLFPRNLSPGVLLMFSSLGGL